MEEGKSSNGLRSRTKYITSRRTKRGVPAATFPPPPPKPKTKSPQIVYREDVGPSETTLQDVLRRFKSFDKSSPQFPDQLIDLLSGEEYKSCIARFQDKDAEWFIDYLDKVLDTLDSFSPAHQKCLRELQETCGARRKLPRSYIPRCMNNTPGHDNCGLGGIFQWRLYWGGTVQFRRMFHLDEVFSSKGTELLHSVIRWKHLNHPNILAPISHNLICAKSGYLFRDKVAWVPCKRLSEYITDEPNIDRLNLLAAIASGLDYLHSHDVVHGDFGEQNIIVDDSGCPRIKEFGMAHLVVAGLTELKLEEYCAYLYYTAPEILNGSGVFSKEADVFSFAMVMAEVFDPDEEFFYISDYEVQSRILGGVRPPRPSRRDLTDELWALTERCWDEDPRQRPAISVVLRTLRVLRGESTGPGRRGTAQSATQDPAKSEHDPGCSRERDGGQSQDTTNALREVVELLDGSDTLQVLPLARTKRFPREEIVTEILDLTDQLASVALFGSIGVGKSFVARAVLDHDQTKAKFGQNSHFIHFDDPKISLEGFIERLSGVIQTSPITSVEQLRSHLESSASLIFLLDGVDFILDQSTTESEAIFSAIEEFGSYDHVCLVTTSRIYPDIPGFHRVEVPTLSEDGAQDTFYGLCNLGQSSAVNTLIARLDFHPLFIDLLASFVRENNWDEAALLKAWGDDQTSALRNRYYEKLKDTIEPMLRSLTIQKLGTTGRDVLEAIASFPSGLKEHDLKNIFHAVAGIGEVVDVLCKFSLVHRRDESVGMLSPFQFYFLESMLVLAETEEVINVRWGPNCMPAPVWLPIYTSGPPSRCHDPLPRRLIHRDDLITGTVTNGILDGDHPHTFQRIEGPRKRKWIKRLPEFVRKRLLAFLGRRTALTIVIGVPDPVDVSSTPPPKGQTLLTMDVPPPPLPKHEVLDALNVAPVHPPEQQASHFRALPFVPPPKQQISHALMPYEAYGDDYPD